MQEASRAREMQLHVLKAGTRGEIDAAFPHLVQLHTDALVVGTDVFFYDQREQLVTLAARHTIPVVYEGRAFPEAGGLLSCGPRTTAINHQLGFYIGKILNGAKPADLPVIQPTVFELVLNLRTAKALALTIPPSILYRADEVIE